MAYKVIILYRLYMPSYFLGTFTEYPEIIAKQMKYCPYCHSDNIEYALNKEKKIRALFATFLSLLTATPLKTEHWEYICKQCGKHFENPVA